MRRFIKYSLIVLLIVILLPIFFLVFMEITDYQPESIEVIEVGDRTEVYSDSAEIEMLIWNIGYCGLNAEMDFFYSGGKSVYPNLETVAKNVQGVNRALAKYYNIDFIMLQEVDKSSLRSHFTNQVDTFSALFKNYSSSYASNYRVRFVPVPVTKPMGSVESGLNTLSKKKAYSVIRYSYEGNFSWPKALFMLDRCFMVNRYGLSSDKDLVMINTHNSAYDTGGLRLAQMEQIKAFVEAEYANGNYVIVGGDWNQCAPNFEADFAINKMDYDSKMDIPNDFMPNDWTWFYDNKLPTNRRNKTSYEKGKTPTTVIDFFLLSPNIKGISISNINMEFKYSDHQPALAKIKLIPQGK